MTLRKTGGRLAAALTVLLNIASARAQSPKAEVSGPVSPSPYDVVRAWQKPFSESGYAFGGNSGGFAELPGRILLLQRGQTRLPDTAHTEFTYFAGSIGINVLSAAERRVMKKNFLYTLDGD